MQVLGHVDAALSAVEDGCDAIMVNSVGDYGLSVMDAILPVPVFGPGKLGLAEASRNNRDFGIVTVWPESMNFIIAERIAAAGCEKNFVGIINVAQEQVLKGLSGKEGYLAQIENAEDGLVEQVKSGIFELIAMGANAVMLGCTCMSGMADEVSGGSRMPIINPLIVAADLARKSQPLAVRPTLQPNHKRLLRQMVDAVAHEQMEDCAVCIPTTALATSAGV